ncbi:MAG TPA: hypothetical protein VKZ67_14320 [Natronosporangium sp.]|nr:hypothetical protein [Natronosporangium sp.]
MTYPDEDPVGTEGAEDLTELSPDERDPEAPDADAAEQATPVDPTERPLRVRRGFEVGEWDAMEQSIVIDLDDEYDR